MSGPQWLSSWTKDPICGKNKENWKKDSWNQGYNQNCWKKNNWKKDSWNQGDGWGSNMQGQRQHSSADAKNKHTRRKKDPVTDSNGKVKPYSQYVLDPQSITLETTLPKSDQQLAPRHIRWIQKFTYRDIFVRIFCQGPTAFIPSRKATIPPKSLVKRAVVKVIL